MAIILGVMLAHSFADFFLEFITVEVGASDSFFLGSAPVGVPTYMLYGDPVAITRGIPGFPISAFLGQIDHIALGRSRFSIFPADMWKRQK